MILCIFPCRGHCRAQWQRQCTRQWPRHFMTLSLPLSLPRAMPPSVAVALQLLLKSNSLSYFVIFLKCNLLQLIITMKVTSLLVTSDYPTLTTLHALRPQKHYNFPTSWYTWRIILWMQVSGRERTTVDEQTAGDMQASALCRWWLAATVLHQPTDISDYDSAENINSSPSHHAPDM